MTREEFERLRDLPDKRIRADIRLTQRGQTAPNMIADNIAIENASGLDVVMNLNYNPEVGSKTINVVLKGQGPICRLDVDGPPHRPAGRSHKHSLKSPLCVMENIKRDVVYRPDLAGKRFDEIFKIFCTMAAITHDGVFHPPDVGEDAGS